MKKILLSLVILSGLVPSSTATESPSSPSQSVTNIDRVKNLESIFKDGKQAGYKKLNESGDGVKIDNGYIVCFDKNGESIIRTVHPDADKRDKDVTNDQVISAIVKKIFEESAKHDGVFETTYEISGITYYAAAIDLNKYDTKTTKGTSIAIATSSKPEEKSKEEKKSVENLKPDENKPESTKEEQKIDPKDKKGANPTNEEKLPVPAEVKK
jgi:hypothetical protein